MQHELTCMLLCRGPKNSTSNLEELISLVPFDDAYSGSLREAVN
jgi:hypothetical protein